MQQNHHIMLLRTLVSFSLVLVLTLPGWSQSNDTLTVIHYNLLYYGNINPPPNCTNTNNNTQSKNGWLNTIITHVQPDLFTANEITSTTAGGLIGLNVLNIRNQALNINGETKWEYVDPTNNASSGIINGIFYNKNKLGYLSQQVISHSLRDVNLVRFYYKSPQLALGADTVKLNVITVHLKAGSTATDASDRLSQTNAIMAAVATQPNGNFILSGDFNIPSSNEASYQALINNSNVAIRFRDPVNFNGTWNNSSLFAPLHTQSTAVSGSCKAGGGMDDRFDFILADRRVMGDSMGVGYIPGSYLALGQDGLRLNNSINSPTNTSVPAAVVNALAEMSDHLPVVLKLKVTQPVVQSLETASQEANWLQSVNFENDYLKLSFYSTERLAMILHDLQGLVIDQFELSPSQQLQTIERHHSGLPDGLYLLKVSNSRGEQQVKKLLKR